MIEDVGISGSGFRLFNHPHLKSGGQGLKKNKGENRVPKPEPECARAEEDADKDSPNELIARFLVIAAARPAEDSSDSVSWLGLHALLEKPTTKGLGFAKRHVHTDTQRHTHTHTLPLSLSPCLFLYLVMSFFRFFFPSFFLAFVLASFCSFFFCYFSLSLALAHTQTVQVYGRRS